MCDAFSFMSAGMSAAGGLAASGMAKAEGIFAQAQGIDAKSRADFEAAQLEAMSVMASAAGSRNETQMRKSYAEQSRQNIAAAAISGFDTASFAAVEDGNAKDLQDNLRLAQQDINREKGSLVAEAGEVRRSGKSAMVMAGFESKMARIKGTMAALSGFNDAIGTLNTANQAFKQYNTGETRGQSFMRSLRGDY